MEDRSEAGASGRDLQTPKQKSDRPREIREHFRGEMRENIRSENVRGEMREGSAEMCRDPMLSAERREFGEEGGRAEEMEGEHLEGEGDQGRVGDATDDKYIILHQVP